MLSGYVATPDSYEAHNHRQKGIIIIITAIIIVIVIIIFILFTVCNRGQLLLTYSVLGNGLSVEDPSYSNIASARLYNKQVIGWLVCADAP